LAITDGALTAVAATAAAPNPVFFRKSRLFIVFHLVLELDLRLARLRRGFETTSSPTPSFRFVNSVLVIPNLYVVRTRSNL
jgi:hypothetical protein